MSSVFRWLYVVVFGLSLSLATGCRENSDVPTTVGPQSGHSNTTTVREAISFAANACPTTKQKIQSETRAVAFKSSKQTPDDDPVADGWKTEAVSTAAMHQLLELDKILATDSVDNSVRLASLTTPEFSCTPLRPPSLREVFHDSSLVVSRPTSGVSDLQEVHRGSHGLDDALRELINSRSGVKSLEAEFKIFRVTIDGDSASTQVYVHLSWRSDKGTFQINGTWTCVWNLAAENGIVRLKSIRLQEFEEVNGLPKSGLSFVDCTESVLGGPVFDRQLRMGLDHWLARIESSLGIDVGGWEGLALGDVNGDDMDDIYLCQPTGLPNRLYVQNPDGTAAEISELAGVDWVEWTHAALLVDLDNDGDQDLALGLPYGLLIAANDGHGRFTPKTAKVLPHALPYSLAAADYDTDGDLDIFICSYNQRDAHDRHVLFARPVPYHDANNGGRNVLLRNDITPSDGQWRFRSVTSLVGLEQNNRRFSYAAAWEDYDNDGDLDLYVANDFGRNNLYRNDGGNFVDVAPQLGVEDIGPGMSACWGDYDNDGWMDLYVSNMFSSAGNRIAFQQRFQQEANQETRSEFQRHARGNSLFRNLGSDEQTGFDDVSENASVTLGRWAWGSKFFDLNNDGWRDLIVTNGFITQEDTSDL